MDTKPTAVGISVFSGHFSVGINKYFDIIAHFENPDFKNFGVDTFKLNFPNVPVYVDKWPVNNYKGCDICYGNPPCFGFSILNTYDRGLDSKWNKYIYELCETGKKLNAKIIVLESVQGLYKKGQELILDISKNILSDYKINIFLTNALNHGVAQNRPRVFFAASKKDYIKFDIPKQQKALVLQDIISDLEKIPVNKGFKQKVGKKFIYNHEIEIRKTSMLNMWKHLKQGESINDLEDQHLSDYFLNKRIEKKRKKIFGFYADTKLRYNKPCPVILTADKYIHPILNRQLSIRERARAMSLPDNFKFSPTINIDKQMAEVGKAIPANVGTYVAEQCYDFLINQNKEIILFDDIPNVTDYTKNWRKNAI